MFNVDESKLAEARKRAGRHTAERSKESKVDSYSRKVNIRSKLTKESFESKYADRPSYRMRMMNK